MDWKTVRGTVFPPNAPNQLWQTDFTPAFAGAGSISRGSAGAGSYIGTSALDAARPVVWDIGAIANSGVPGALKLYHDIIQASASIPGAFPPVLIEVEVDGKQYSELHVDGGVTSQVFAYPAQIELKDFDKLVPTGFERTVYVIRNTNVHPPYENIRPRILPLVRRAISVLISYQPREQIGKLLKCRDFSHVRTIAC